MKVRFILSFFSLLLLVGGVLANDAVTYKYSGPKVVLKGEIGRETSRSVPVIPIEAIISDDVVHIIFEAPLGTVEILVNGEVQEVCEVTTSGQETSFSVEGWAPGTYTLEFKTPKGGYVSGEFTIE